LSPRLLDRRFPGRRIAHKLPLIRHRGPERVLGINGIGHWVLDLSSTGTMPDNVHSERTGRPLSLASGGAYRSDGSLPFFAMQVQPPLIRPYRPEDKPSALQIWIDASAIAHPFFSEQQLLEQKK